MRLLKRYGGRPVVQKDSHTDSYKIMRYTGALFMVGGAAVALCLGPAVADRLIMGLAMFVLGLLVFSIPPRFEAWLRSHPVPPTPRHVFKYWVIGSVLLAGAGVAVAVLWNRDWGIVMAFAGVVLAGRTLLDWRKSSS